MSCTLGAPLSQAGGITIAGLDLARPLPPVLREQIRVALRDHHVLVFPNQTLSREDQFAFTANFGA
ncbi:MAG: TauD/TfdA family dioxygenase, partial [Alphaproteobacteria bacterium]|nr:TauD/TfdA family dioxygenase [Alphaproteobacteria bacterium]